MRRTTCIFIRHAPTLENHKHIMIGRTDPPLHAVGHEQAAQVADALLGLPLRALVTSPLARAVQTAAELGRRDASIDVIEDVRLAEVHLGVVDGVSSFAAYETYRREFDVALSPETRDFAFPDGETWSTAVARIQAVMADIATDYAGDMVGIVTHGAILGLWRAVLEGKPLGHFRTFQPKHASISVAAHSGGRWSVVRWNDCRHLREGNAHTAGDKGDFTPIR